MATPATEYRVPWARFDNATNTATPECTAIVAKEMRLGVPSAFANAAPGDIIQATVVATHPSFASWAVPVTVHFRRTAGGWQLIGVER